MWISLDGYIAKTNYSTDWIAEKDFEIFDEKVQNAWCIIMWYTTFKEVWITKWIQHIVLSSKQSHSNQENVHYCAWTQEAIEIVSSLWYTEVLIIWWGICNSSFLQAQLIDEIIVDVQPVILGKGIKIFEDMETYVELDFVEHQSLAWWLNILRYRVKK